MATFFELLKRIVSSVPKSVDGTVRSGKEVFPRVYDSQLEDRRVLNAGAVVSAMDLVALHFDAGQSANDGIADKFELTRLNTPNATSQIAVTINNQRVWQGNSAELLSIRFDGSSDADQFYIDPTIQVPAGITIDGTGIATRSPAPGTTDTIVFATVSGTHFDEITYRTTDHLTQVRFVMPATPLNAAYPLIASSPSHAVVAVQNVEIIQDLNFASNRSMVVESSSGMYSLKGSAEPDRSSANHSVQWTSDQGRIHFAVPSNRLAIDFRGATAGQHSLTMDSMDLSGVEQFEVFGKDLDSVQQHGDLLTGRKMSIQAGAIHVDGTVTTATDGELRLDAGSGDLTVNGQILSRGDDLHRGGNVVLTGERVLLQERTRVDVSGGRGGGQIRVGGGYQGQDSGVRNSLYTYVSANASLNADARLNGDGGTVIVWSDDTSIIDGSGNIFARGGIHSGNGGFIETSGKNYLRIDGAANTFAYQGQVGTWLIDPNDIEIVTAAGAAANTTYITTATIASGLTTGNVSIITNTASPANGDIRIVAALTLSPTVSRTLTLNATRDIVFQSGLTGNANLQVNLTAGRNVDSTAVSIGQLGSLTIIAAGNISVGAMNLSGGTLTATVDSDDNTNDATFQSTGALSAGSISIFGSAAGTDDLTFGSTVTTTTGAIQFTALDDLLFQGDVTSATNITFATVSGPLSLGSNVDITSNSGALDFSTIGSGIVLNGANATTNVITANSLTGSIRLPVVSATNTSVSLTLNSATDLDADDINIQSGDLVATYSGQDGSANVATFQTVTARSMTVSGNSRTNDQTVLADTLTIGIGGVTINQFSDLRINASVTSDAGVTTTGTASSTTRLAANVTSKGGNIAMTGGTLLINGSATRTISSGGGGVAAGGNIVLGNMDGENGAASLTVDSRGTTTAGAVTLGAVTDDTSGLNRLNIQSSASGQVTLSSTRLVGKAVNTAATLVVSSGGNAIRANGVIDLSSNSTIDGGSIDFGSSQITPTTASSTLTLRTSNTNPSGGNGGDIKFGGVSNNGANYFDSVQIDTSVANNGRTAGDLDFNGAASPRIAVDGTTGTGISLIGTIVKAFSGVLSFLTNPTGASTSSSSINVSQADFQSTAGLAFDTSGGGASTNAGNVVLGDIGVLVANRPSSLTVDTRGSATSGELQLDDGAGASTEVHVNSDLNLTNIRIKLTDNALLRTYGTGNMTLGDVSTSTAVARNLTLNSEANIAVSAINLTGGTLNATVDSNDNNGNATFQSTGALSAGAISIIGSATGDDDLTFGSTVTTTTGAIQFSDLDDLSFQGDVTSAANITFATVSGPLSLGSNVDITSNSGALDFSTIGSGIVLNGANATTNVITANSLTGSIRLPVVSATNTSVSLTLNSATNLDADDINIQSGDLVATYSGQDGSANVATFQTVTARSMTVSGNSRTNDQTVLADTLTIGIGGVTINQFSDLRINASVTSDAGVTTTGTASSTTRLAANVTSKGGNIAMTGGTLLINGSATRTISSGGGGVAAGGNIVLGNMDGENGAASLTVDSRGTTTAGAVTLGAVTDDTSGLNRLNIQSSASGQVTLSSTRLVGKAVNTAATLVVSSGGNAIRANGVIDLSSNSTIDGGSIDFGSSQITPTTASSTLTLRTSNTNPSGGNGGDIKFGGVSNNGANYFDSVQIDTSVANNGRTAGDLDFNGAASPRIAVDGTAGTGISLIGTIVKSFSGVLSFLTNPTGASTSSSSINVSQADFQSTAGLAFDTSGGGASTNAGNVVLGDIGVLVANRPSSLTVDTRGSATSGELQLDDGAGASTEVHVNSDLNLTNIRIKLTDNALLRTYGTGNMTLGDVSTSTAVARNLTLNSEANIAVSAINLTGGTLTATVDSDNNTNNATFQSTGALSAGSISMFGSADGTDDLTFGSTVTTTAGAIQFTALDDLSFQGDVTSAANITFATVSGPLSLGSNVDITSNSGSLDFSTIGSGIVLNGANATTNVITANSLTGSIRLPVVSATNTSVSLTLNSATDLDADDINIQSGDLVATYSGQDGSTNVATFQTVTARSMTISGNSRTNDQTVLADTLTIGIGGVTINQFSDLRINASVTSDAGVTTTGSAGSTTRLAANVTSKGGDIAMTGGTLLINGSATRTIFSGGGGVAAGGNIVLGNMDGENGAASLTVDSRGTTTAGAVTIGAVTDDTSGLNRLNIQANASTASGQVTLSSTRLVGKTPGTAATLVVSSGGNAIRANGVIDLSSNSTIDGGSIDFGSSQITPTTASSTLTLRTSNTNPSGGNGGDIKFGGVSNNGANYFDSVQIDTSVANNGSTAGDLDFNGAASPRIAVDGTAGTGISLIGTIVKAFSGVLSFLTNPTGASTSSSSINVSQADFQSTAGLAFDTSGGGASTSAGNVVLGDIGVLAANRPNALLIDTRGSATSGELQLDDGAGASTEVHVNSDLNLTNIRIKLTDNALLRTYGTGNMTLGDVSTSTAVARNLTLNSEANIAVSAINLTGGTLNASIDSDNNNAGATFQSTGVLTAGTVTITGSTALNDQVTISSTLTTTTGAIQFSQIGSLVLNGDVTAQTSVAFNSVANELILGSNVDVTANNGPIDFSVIASGIRLTGSNGSTNILTANGATGNLSLGNVLVNNTSVSLTLRSAANTTVGSINLQNGTFTSSIDSDNDNLGSTFVSTGALSAGAVTISGSTTVNDDVTLGSTVTTTTGAIQVIRFDDLRINGDWTSAGGVTTTGISVSKTHLAANITTNGGNVSMLDGTLLVNGTTARQIKSGGATINAMNAGNVAIGAIDGEVSTADLVIDSRGANASGDVSIGDVTAATGNTGLNRLRIFTVGTTPGQVSLSNIRLIAHNGAAAFLGISSGGRSILAEGTIDLSSNVNGQAGGNVDLGISIVAPKNANSTLAINTSNTNTTSGVDGSNGGDVFLGGIGVNSAAATYFNSVTFDLSAADILDSAGTLRFGGVTAPTIQVDGVTGTGIQISGRVENAAGGTLSMSTNPAGAVQNTSAIDMTKANFIGSGGLVFDTSGGNRATNSGSVSLGDIGITVRPVSLVVDTRGTVSSGHLLFNDGVAGSPTEIRVDGTIDFSNVAVDLLDDVSLSSFSDGSSLLLGTTNAIGGARSLQLSSNGGMTVASINLTGGAFQAIVDANNNEAGATFRSTGPISTGSFALNGSASNDDTAIIETSLTTTGAVIVSNLDQLRLQGTVTAGTTFTATNIVGAVDFSGNSGITANGSVDLQTSVNAVRLSGVAGNTTLIDARGNASVVTLAAVTATNPGTRLNIRSDYSADLRNVDMQTGTLDILVGRSTTLTDSKAQLRQVIAGGLVVAGTSTANDSVVLDGLLDIGAGGVRIQNLANLDMNFNIQSDGELVATNIGNRIRVAEAVSVQSDLGVDMQTNVGQIQLIGINGLTNLFRANGDSSTLRLAAIQALQNVVLQITSANNIQVTSIDAVGSNVTIDVDSNDNSVGSQLNAGQIQGAQITILGGSEQNDTATFSGVVESKAGSILVTSFGTVNVNGNLLSSAGLEVSNVSGRVSLGAGRLVRASNGDASLNSGVNEIRFVGGTGTTASIQSLNGNLSVAALTELATSDLIDLRADRDVALRSTLLNSRLQVIAGDRNSNTGTINATSTLTAGSISFEAATGIGTNAPVAISTSTISASNRLAGAVQLANNKSGTILVTNLTSNQGGNILFAQSGGGLVRFQGVTSNPDGTPALVESDIRLTNNGNSIIVEGTGVSAGGLGNVSLETLNSGDVVLTSATQAIGGNVGVQSARRILGGGTLRGPSIGLNAQSGIGTFGPIQTETAQLSVNTQFNSVDVQNASPTLATVSQLRSGGLGTVQFKQVGGGDVAISNVSTGLASTNAGSNIQLSNDNGSVQIQGSVVAGGGGSIRFDAQNNLVIGAGAIVQTNAVNATIRGDAGGQFRFTPGATLRAGSSNATTEAVVTEIPPAVSVRPALNSLGVNVDSLGQASLQIQLGSSPFIDRNYSVVIDWGDNQIDNFANGSISPLTINPQISRFDASGAIYTITHQYQGNPNIVDPIADIPVKVTVGIDALNRIQFNDSQGASTNLTRVINERFVVPAAGLFTLRFDLPQAATVQSRIVFTNSVLVQADNNVAPPVPSAEIVVSSGGSAAEKSRSYVLRVITLVSEQGEIASSKDIELSEKDIEDLSSGKLFQKLGDNRYRIYLIREDGSELLLKDFYLRNHRPFEVEDAPASSNIAPPDERVLDQGSVSNPRQNHGSAALGNGEFGAREPEVQELGAMRSEATSEEEPIANALLAVGTVSQARRSWRKAARRFRAS